MPERERSLKELLFETVEGFEDLAVLVWFYDTDHAEGVESSTVAKGASVPEEEASAALERLAARGILEVESTEPKRFRAARDDAMRDRARRVASEYRTNGAQVMRLLTENAIERVKTAALRTFAECFRIRGPK